MKDIKGTSPYKVRLVKIISHFSQHPLSEPLTVLGSFYRAQRVLQKRFTLIQIIPKNTHDTSLTLNVEPELEPEVREVSRYLIF